MAGEIRVHGVQVGDRTLIVCTHCGPVGVFSAAVIPAVEAHREDHEQVTEGAR